MSAPIELESLDHTGLQAALGLSLATGVPFALRAFRAGRPKPGVAPGDLALLRAAQTVGAASVEDAAEGASDLLFRPGRVAGGDFIVDVGSSPVARALLALAPALALGPARATLKLRGCTHGPGAPSHHALALAWVPALASLGFRVSLELRAAGYPPEGGGEQTAVIEPGGVARPFDRRHRGTLEEVRVLSLVSRLPFALAEAQGAHARERLRALGIASESENLPVPAPRSRGLHALVLATFEHGLIAVDGAREAEQPAERAGDAAAEAFGTFIERQGALPPWLADALLVPLALVAAGHRGQRAVSWLSTSEVTPAAVEVARVISRFLDVEVAVLATVGEPGEVRVAPREASLAETIRSRREK